MIQFWVGQKNRSWLKLTGGLVATSFFFTTVSAPFASANLWNERRKAVEDLKKEPMELASATGLPSYETMVGNSIALPTPETLVSHGAMQELLNKVRSGRIQHSSKIHLDLPQAFVNQVETYGEVERLYLANSQTLKLSNSLNSPILQLINPNSTTPNSKSLVILIQDAHGIYGVQKNISELIKGLNNFGVRLVGVEGASGEMTGVYQWRNYPDKASLMKVANYLLEKGLLSGVEVAGLASSPISSNYLKHGKLCENKVHDTCLKNHLVSSGVEFYGVEEKDNYLEQVKSFTDTIVGNREVSSWLEKTKTAIESSKGRIYSLELKQLDKNRDLYEKGELKLGEWIQGLSKRDSKILTFNLSKYAKAYELEKTINFKEVSAEQKKILEQLSQKLTKNQLVELLEESLAYRLGKISYVEFYAALKDRCEKAKLFIAPELDKYMKYVVLVDGIDREKLFEEVKKLEDQVVGYLMKGASANIRSLVQMDQDYRLLTKALDFKLSPEEWKEFNQRKGEIEKIGIQVLNPQTQPVQEALKNVSRFNELSHERNQIFVQKLISKLESRNLNSKNSKTEDLNSGSRISALVAGGYHTRGLEELLKKKDISYIVIRPNMETSDLKEDYHPLNAFKRDALPLEKMFYPEKLTINPPQALEGAVKLNRDDKLASIVGRTFKILTPAESSSNGIKDKIAEAANVQIKEEKSEQGVTIVNVRDGQRSYRFYKTLAKNNEAIQELLKKQKNKIKETESIDFKDGSKRVLALEKPSFLAQVKPFSIPPKVKSKVRQGFMIVYALLAAACGNAFNINMNAPLVDVKAEANVNIENNVDINFNKGDVTGKNYWEIKSSDGRFTARFVKDISSRLMYGQGELIITDHVTGRKKKTTIRGSIENPQFVGRRLVLLVKDEPFEKDKNDGYGPRVFIKTYAALEGDEEYIITYEKKRYKNIKNYEFSSDQEYVVIHEDDQGRSSLHVRRLRDGMHMGGSNIFFNNQPLLNAMPMVLEKKEDGDYVIIRNQQGQSTIYKLNKNGGFILVTNVETLSQLQAGASPGQEIDIVTGKALSAVEANTISLPLVGRDNMGITATKRRGVAIFYDKDEKGNPITIVKYSPETHVEREFIASGVWHRVGGEKGIVINKPYYFSVDGDKDQEIILEIKDDKLRSHGFSLRKLEKGKWRTGILSPDLRLADTTLGQMRVREINIYANSPHSQGTFRVRGFGDYSKLFTDPTNMFTENANHTLSLSDHVINGARDFFLGFVGIPTEAKEKGSPVYVKQSPRPRADYSVGDRYISEMMRGEVVVMGKQKIDSSKPTSGHRESQLLFFLILLAPAIIILLAYMRHKDIEARNEDSPAAILSKKIAKYQFDKLIAAPWIESALFQFIPLTIAVIFFGLEFGTIGFSIVASMGVAVNVTFFSIHNGIPRHISMLIEGILVLPIRGAIFVFSFALALPMVSSLYSAPFSLFMSLTFAYLIEAFSISVYNLLVLSLSDQFISRELSKPVPGKSEEEFKSIAVVETQGTESSEFSYPHDIMFDSEGNLWVVETDSNRLQIWNKDTGEWSVVENVGTEIGEFTFPRSIEFDTDGNLWVMDSNNNRLKVDSDSLRDILKDEGGQANVEYSLILAIFAAVALILLNACPPAQAAVLLSQNATASVTTSAATSSSILDGSILGWIAHGMNSGGLESIVFIGFVAGLVLFLAWKYDSLPLGRNISDDWKVPGGRLFSFYAPLAGVVLLFNTACAAIGLPNLIPATTPTPTVAQASGATASAVVSPTPATTPQPTETAAVITTPQPSQTPQNIATDSIVVEYAGNYPHKYPLFEQNPNNPVTHVRQNLLASAENEHLRADAIGFSYYGPHISGGPGFKLILTEPGTMKYKHSFWVDYTRGYPLKVHISPNGKTVGVQFNTYNRIKGVETHYYELFDLNGNKILQFPVQDKNYRYDRQVNAAIKDVVIDDTNILFTYQVVRVGMDNGYDRGFKVMGLDETLSIPYLSSEEEIKGVIDAKFGDFVKNEQSHYLFSQSDDQKLEVYVNNDNVEKRHSLILKNLETGLERVIFTHSYDEYRTSVWDVRFSPDSRYLVMKRDDESITSTLIVLDRNGDVVFEFFGKGNEKMIIRDFTVSNDAIVVKYTAIIPEKNPSGSTSYTYPYGTTEQTETLPLGSARTSLLDLAKDFIAGFTGDLPAMAAENEATFSVSPKPEPSPMQKINELIKENDGKAMSEYGLIIALAAVLAIINPPIGLTILGAVVASHFVARVFRTIQDKKAKVNAEISKKIEEAKDVEVGKLDEKIIAIALKGSANDLDSATKAELKRYIEESLAKISTYEDRVEDERVVTEKIQQILFAISASGGDVELLQKIFKEQEVVPTKELLQYFDVRAKRAHKEDYVKAQWILGGLKLNQENARAFEAAYNRGVILLSWAKKMVQQVLMSITKLGKGFKVIDATPLMNGTEEEKAKTSLAIKKLAESGEKFALQAKGYSSETIEQNLHQTKELAGVDLTNILYLQAQQGEKMSLDELFKELDGMKLAGLGVKVITANLDNWDWETNENKNIDIYYLLEAAFLKPVLKLKELSDEFAHERFLKINA
ncbi:MAG: hypothetical protein HYT97_01085 [Elusimicrobia bacterium]|nr:hypothetical protein [Elusimicrobiota bacterium]